MILTSATDPAKVMSLSGIQSEEGDKVYYTALSLIHIWGSGSR